MMTISDIVQIILFCALIFFRWAIWRVIRYAVSVIRPGCYLPNLVM